MAEQGEIACAIWIRVSTDHQESANQVPDIKRFCAHRGYEITERYEISDSAWKQGPEYREALNTLLADAHAGHFKTLVVWALDRIVRSGSEPGMSAAEEALKLIRQLGQRHVSLISVKEDWLQANSEIQSVLVSFAAWMAEQESKRKSERIRAGLARAKANGQPIGRKAGAKDKRQRKTGGYLGNQNAAKGSDQRLRARVSV
jgi:DNA invertase Pin-like site-specific DNA recombinase